jgi:WD40 repeat protein
MEAITTFEGHRAPVYVLAAGADAAHFISGSGDGLVAEWERDDPAKGRGLARVGEAVFAALVMPTHQLLIIGTEGGSLHVVDLRDRAEKHRFTVHRTGIFTLLALDADRFVCAGGDGLLSIWQALPATENGPRCTLLRQFPLVEEKLRGLALEPGGRHLAVACGDGSVRLLDTTLFNEHLTLEAHADGASSVAYHPTKPVLFSGGKDGHLRAWAVEEGYREVLALPAHRAAIYGLAFRADGSLLASAGRDKAVKIWDGSDLSPVARHERSTGGHTHSVNAVLWMGDTLLSAGDDRVIRAFRPTSR